MKRMFVALFAMTVLFACGKGQDEGGGTASEETASTAGDVRSGQPPEGESEPRIDEGEFSQFEEYVKGYLRPYFDEAGSQTSISLAPGEYFDVYVFAEFNEPYVMNSAEYKLVLPDGVTLLSPVLTDSTILSWGAHEEDFMIVFRCAPGPRLWLAKYQCKANEDFAGGIIETVRGQSMNFLGFVMCDASKTQIRARGGTAELRRK